MMVKVMMMMMTSKMLQAKLMGKRTDEVAKMVVEHYKLPMEPKDWIDRTRYNDYDDQGIQMTYVDLDYYQHI